MTVEVHVVTPEREVWSGEADELIARGVDGEVGILGGHAPLLVQLAIGPLRMLADGGETVAVVDGGFLHVATEAGVTRADVLATHAELAGEIDVDAARRRLEEWEGRTDEEDDERAKAEIAKAMARIAIAGEVSAARPGA
ncbi:MAG TPA: ATP synthase F1 subunit epsilon [Actinomycetota bacterium]|nr:ATP synthase F1 subunit epsilon [Actinomycetota bacterium]